MHSVARLIAILAFAGKLGESLTLPFGTEVGDTETGPNDDGSSAGISLPFPMIFYGQPVNSIYQNTNGDITFDATYSVFTPELIPSDSVPPMIAIYWTDIDTRNGGDPMIQNGLFVRASTNIDDATTASGLIRRLGGAAANFSPTATIVATWNNVEAYSRRVDKQNRFQLIVAYNDQRTYAIFDYRQLEFWSTDTSTKTVIGFNDEQGIEGLLVAILENDEDMIGLLGGTNVGLPGIYIYRVDEFEDSGCGSLILEPVARPSFGPQVGGTVLHIQNLPFCLSVETIYCRFTAGERNVVETGFLVQDDTAECVVPFWGDKSSLLVEYAAHNIADGEFDEGSAD